MVDAREIIAQEFRQAHRDTCYPDATDDECEIAASVIVSSINDAGFRIIGPDEVDQVTLENAAMEAHKLLLRAADSFEAHAKTADAPDEIDGCFGSAEMYREVAYALKAAMEAQK